MRAGFARLIHLRRRYWKRDGREFRTLETLQLPMETLGQLTCSSEERPANRFPFKDYELALLILAATSRCNMHDFSACFAQRGSSGKTSAACCRWTKGEPLPPSSNCWGNAGIGSPGGCLTFEVSESPSGDGACSLWDILETGDHLRPYCLPPATIENIIGRAEKYGKTLSIPIQEALRSGAGRAMLRQSLPKTRVRRSEPSKAAKELALPVATLFDDLHPSNGSG